MRRARWLHFALAGLLLFISDAIRRPPDRETIAVTREIVESLVRSQEELSGAPVSAGERKAIAAAYAFDEILLREAYARDLHRQDGLVRKRLLELMRFLLIEEPAEPTERELADYLATHRENYLGPPTVTLSHVYFGADRPAAAADAERALAKLRSGADLRTFGDPFWLGRRLEEYGEPQLVQLFGREFTKGVFSQPLAEWSRPIASTRGLHLVRVDRYRPAAMPPPAEFAAALRVDWIATRREELLRKKVDELRAKYNVELAPGVER